MAPAHPARRPLVMREQRHQRRVLLSLAALLVLSISPVVGHHMLRGVSLLPRSLDRVGDFCITSLHRLFEPVHALSHALLYAGLAWAVVDRVRASLAHRRVMRALIVRHPAPATPVARATNTIGFAVARVRVVDGLPTPAFTSGWWTPTVFIAGWLPDRLTQTELEAVLSHEAAHVLRRDPLRLFLLRTLSRLLFWLPALHRLTEDWADEAEIAADDVAARTHALPLASAILAMVGEHTSEDTVATAIGFQHADLLERRIRRLAGEDPAVGTHVSWGAVAGAAAALIVVWSAGVVVTHPIPQLGTGLCTQSILSNVVPRATP